EPGEPAASAAGWGLHPTADAAGSPGHAPLTLFSIKESSLMRLVSPALVLLLAAPCFAEPPRIVPAGIEGSLVLCGKGEASEAILDRFLDLAGGAKAHVVALREGRRLRQRAEARKWP